MAKTMNKRSGHKRSVHKRSGHKRTAKKERKDKRGTRGYRKGSKSKTMKGKKDFTTKKSSKVFNRRKHYQKHAKGSRVIRRPYHKKGGDAGLKRPQPKVTVHSFGPKGTGIPKTGLRPTRTVRPGGDWENPSTSLSDGKQMGNEPGGIYMNSKGQIEQRPSSPAGTICSGVHCINLLNQ